MWADWWSHSEMMTAFALAHSSRKAHIHNAFLNLTRPYTHTHLNTNRTVQILHKGPPWNVTNPQSGQQGYFGFQTITGKAMNSYPCKYTVVVQTAPSFECPGCQNLCLVGDVIPMWSPNQNRKGKQWRLAKKKKLWKLAVHDWRNPYQS